MDTISQSSQTSLSNELSVPTFNNSDIQALDLSTTKSILLQLNYLCKVRHSLFLLLLQSIDQVPVITNDEYATAYIRYHDQISTCIQQICVDIIDDHDQGINSQQHSSLHYLKFLRTRELYQTLFIEYVTHSMMVNTLITMSVQGHYDAIFEQYPLSRCQILGLQDPIRKYSHISKSLFVDFPIEEGKELVYHKRETTTGLVYGEFTLQAIAHTMWSEAIDVHNILFNIHYQEHFPSFITPEEVANTQRPNNKEQNDIDNRVDIHSLPRFFWDTTTATTTTSMTTTTTALTTTNTYTSGDEYDYDIDELSSVLSHQIDHMTINSDTNNNITLIPIDPITNHSIELFPISNIKDDTIILIPIHHMKDNSTIIKTIQDDLLISSLPLLSTISPATATTIRDDTAVLSIPILNNINNGIFVNNINLEHEIEVELFAQVVQVAPTPTLLTHPTTLPTSPTFSHLQCFAGLHSPPLPTAVDFDLDNEPYIETLDTIWLYDTASKSTLSVKSTNSVVSNTAMTSDSAGSSSSRSKRRGKNKIAPLPTSSLFLDVIKKEAPKIPQGMSFNNANIRNYVDDTTYLNYSSIPSATLDRNTSSSLSSLLQEQSHQPQPHQPRPQHVFMDLGGGVAKLTLYLSFLTNAFSSSCSIEVIPTFHNLACQFAEHIDLFRKQDRVVPTKLHDSSIHLLNGSFFDLDWSYSDVVVTTSTCFSAEMFAQLSFRAQQLKPGTIFVTLSEQLQHPTVELLYSIILPMTWGPAIAHFHIRK